MNNVDVLGVEFAQNFKSVTDMWNRKTNSWLRYFVYMRLTPENGKASFFVTMLTYLTSAFWHVRALSPSRSSGVPPASFARSPARSLKQSGFGVAWATPNARRGSTLATT